MTDKKKLIQEYLKNARVMQLATSVKNKPWVCNVHFYSDESLNFYWTSISTRRHSEEIAKNQHVSAAIKIHEDSNEEPYVIGISVEGKAELCSHREIEKIGKLYIKKLSKDPNLIRDILLGKNPQVFYKLQTENIVLFDTKEFPDNPRQEYSL